MNMQVCGRLPSAAGERRAIKTRRAHCSGAPYEYAHVRYLAPGWKRMENDKKSAGSLQRGAL